MKRWTLLLLFVSIRCFASTYYVANTGNDSNPGSQALPFAILRQVSAGTTLASRTVSRTVNAGTYYHIKIVFNGTNFQVYVDNVLIITLAPGNTPSGKVGFKSWSPNNKTKTSSFKGIVVY